MTKWILLLSLMLAIFDSETANKWCKKYLCKQRHPLCTDNRKFQATCPHRATAMVKITKEIEHLIVDKHNEYRNKFAGGMGNHAKAARMPTIQWDSELAEVADALVRRCQPIRDSCVMTGRYHHAEVSYSLIKYYCMTTKMDALRTQLDYWFDPESKDEVIELFFSEKDDDQELSQNYFQVLRDRADRIGCAIVEYIHPALVHQLLKCVYNCGVSQCEDDHNPVYEISRDYAATHCRKGSNKEYKNLCHKSESVKSCDGGSAFVDHADDYDDDNEKNRGTTISIPKYNPNGDLPPIPDNPHIRKKGRNKENTELPSTTESSSEDPEADYALGPYNRLNGLPPIPDNPVIDFRTNKKNIKNEYEDEMEEDAKWHPIPDIDNPNILITL
ncbi:uncharacterized protein LOC121530557 [Drosophila eugracilis]|uniref:uncharacterized protein LOC121530557 n=1 Tax=Drosophila eugracilis TaxID=29029 RepID=UPI001BD990F4|nr:uncharacterized protein LOC121530557 [Drosophila eugracilis]